MKLAEPAREFNQTWRARRHLSRAGVPHAAPVRANLGCGCAFVVK